jgi:hypothetical protein
VLDRFANPAELCHYFKANHPLVVGMYQELAGEPIRLAMLDQDFAESATRWNRGGPDGPAIYELEYMVVVARKP